MSESEDAARAEAEVGGVGESRGDVDAGAGTCFLRSRQGLSSALASFRRRFERARAGGADVVDIDAGSAVSVSVSTSRSSASSGEGRFVPARRGSDGGTRGGDGGACILRCCCSGDGEDGGELRGDDAGWLRRGLGPGDAVRWSRPRHGSGSGSKAVGTGEAARD